MVIYNSDNSPFLSIEVDDSSYHYRKLMSDDTLVLEFSLAEHVEIPVGAWCEFEAQKYILMELSAVTIHHRRDYEYTVTMLGPLAETDNYIVHNTVDHRIKFDLTARPEEHLAMIVANLNERDGAGTWTAGACINATEKTISYNMTTCRDAITAIATTFETEFEVVSHTINIGKVEYYKANPLSLSYGKNNGLTTGIKRVASSMPVGKVYIQGGDRNISLSEYGSSTLHLPQGVTFRFDGEDFVNSGGVQMSTDPNGYSVSVVGSPSNATELSLDLSNIYPKRIGEVSGVRFEYRGGYYTYAELITAFPSLTDDDWDEVQVDFYDSTIPASLDYAECQMTNDQPLTVIFQSGQLIGREFQVNFIKEATDTKPANRFELIKTDIDGVNMPTRNFLPANGNEYAVFNCYLPSEYINDPDTKTGAEWDALREAAKFLYENMDAKVSYRGDIDGIVAKRNWTNIGDYLKCGSYISFSDPSVQPTAIDVRIVGVKQYVNDPYKPTIEFSNELAVTTKSSQIKQLQAESVHVEELNKQSQRYAQRSFRNAKETMQMLIDAALDGYTEQISPIAVQTMQMIVGDERLQFLFFEEAACVTRTDPVHFDPATKQLSCDAVYLKHMTLGIDTIAPDHSTDTYKVWEMDDYTSAVLSDPEKRYYLYAKVSTNTSTAGTYSLEEEESALPFEQKTNNVVTGYNLLVGILNSEVNGERSYAPLYGFTEILPGQITTDKIRSSDGNSWIDLAGNKMRFGDASASLSWNEDGSRELRITGGTIVQSSGSGPTSLITCDRGAYDNTATYYYADEVYTSDGASYIYINPTPSSGHTPPNSTYWYCKREAGSSARLVTLTASSLFFTYDNKDSQTPTGDTSITLTCTTQNIASPTYQWYYMTGSTSVAISGQTGSTLTIGYNHAAFLGGNVAKIMVRVNNDPDLYDETAIYKVYGGKDGENVLIVDVNNEMDSVELDSNGRAKSARTLTTTATIYYGADAQEITAATMTGHPQGVTYSVTLGAQNKSAIYSISVASGTVLSSSQDFVLHITCAKGTGDVPFTVLGLKEGAPSYSIVPSVPVISRDKNNVCDPAGITCEVKKSTSNGYTDGLADGTLRYYLDSSSTANTYTENSTIYVGSGSGQFLDKIRFEFVLNNTIVDKETVYVIDDGEDGEDSISAFLDNPSHQFAAGETYAADGSDTFEVIVFRGKDRLTAGQNFDIGTLTVSPNTVVMYPTTNWMMRVQANTTNNVQNGTITVTVTNKLNVREGSVSIPIVVHSNDNTTTNITLEYKWRLATPGARGERGAKLRGPTQWNSSTVYEDGSGEFQDIVRSNTGKYYICQISNSNTDPDVAANQGEGKPWGKFSETEYLATKLLYTPDAIIGDLVVDKLFTKKTVSGVEKNPISIQGEMMTIKDDNNNVKVTVTSGSLDTSGRSTGQYAVWSQRKATYSLAENEYATNISDDITLSSTDVMVSASNNIVTTPAFTLSKTGPTNSGQYILYWALYLGDRIVCSGGGSALGSIPETTLSMPEGTYTLHLKLSGTLWQESGSASSMEVTIDRSSQYVTVQYPTQFTAIASDGARFQYGTDGVQFDASGPHVLQGGGTYNMLAGGTLNASTLPAPKRIVVCAEYPSNNAMEEDVLYIKVGSSS